MTASMDLAGPQDVLTNILTQDELQTVESGVQDKLRKYLDEFLNDYYKDKAAANRLHDYELKADELQAQIQDNDVKLQSFNQNVTELRSQLDTVSAERKQLQETTSSYERELASLRNDKKAISDERDHLLKVIERQNSEVDRLQQDLKTYQQQLKAAIGAKCEALARVDEIEGKEVSLDFKERRMEQERDMLHKQIQTLTQDLNRNISELQNIRRENTMNGMQLEARLAEKTEEVKIAHVQCTQYKETIERLTQTVQELSSKMLAQNEEAQKMMDFYRKELDAKTKLSDLYKSNCEDTDMERSELSNAITELKRMLADASDQYGELETTFKGTQLKHEQELEEKNKSIDALKEEMKHANDLLKELQDESVDNAISKLAPTAAVASRLIRSDMSLTELYSLYARTSEESELQKREIARLNLQIKTILSELNENAPMVKKQELEYEKLLETNNVLAQQRDELLSKKTDFEELLIEAHAKMSHMDRENKKLKHSQNDLSRQVCYLLKEVEQLRIGLTSDGPNVSSSFGNVTTTDEIISKKLVTFNTISELQENNQKLLLLVRDLSTKLEETEAHNREMDEAAYQEKLDGYATKFQSMQDTLNQQNSTVATLVSKCERYKKLYFELQRKLNKNSTSIHDDMMSENEDDEMQADDGDVSINMSTKSPRNSKSMRDHDKRIRDLEQQLQDVKEQYKTQKEQYEYYIKEKKNNEKILNEQFDSMRSEVRDLTSTNCKLMSTLEYNKEQLKLQQKNIGTYKQQITALEDRNKNYENTIVKHEQTVLYLKDEIMKSQRQQSAAESEASRVRHENRILKDTVGRLQSEKESHHREQQSQTLLLNNLELIKSNLERSETEGKARLEQRLDETVRELSAQRRRFQEEEDRFRETTNDFKRQAESAKKQMQEEKELADKLRIELINVREELSAKTQQIDELSKKLQESLTPSKNDNPIVLANKKAREFEVKYEESKIEIESLRTSLNKAKEHADQYYKMSQNAETEIKNLHELHTSYKDKAEAEIKDYYNSEMNLKSRITELEAELQLVAVAEAPIPSQHPAEKVKRVQDELKDALQKLSECNRNLRTLRAENITLSETLNSVETKYANEMILHSSDIQELGKVKQELVKVQSQINELSVDRDNAKSSLANLQKSQEESLILLRKEKEEFEKRVEDLNSLNANLHDQIEALSNKLTTLSQNATNNAAAGASTNPNESQLMDTSSTELNRSVVDAEADNKSNGQLLQIIKFLRKEKDLTVAKLDILKAENTRLQSEFTILQKKNDELQDFLNRERSKTDTNLVSASKHEEILRKIETLNAVTDSNRVLREERNALTQRVKELNDRIGSLEDELFPLQSQNRDLNTKIEELQSETGSLRTEALKWRQRANVLVEKSNKNPEEFKRLQSERENLAKMLTAEKEQIKMLTDEVQTQKTDKTRIDGELASLERQLHMMSEEKKSLTADVATMRLTNTRLMQEVMEMKNKLLAKEESVQKCSEDLEAKEQLLQDSKNKEVQIRKIAKRYKDSYLELLNKTPTPSADGNAATGTGDNMELNASNTTAEAGGATSAELEQQRTTIESLNEVIRNMQEENEKVRKDYEGLKASVEIDERTKTLLREAKSHIVSLTEARNSVNNELATTKTKLLQSKESHDAAVNEIKAQYDNNLQRLERELMEQNNRNKEDVQRLTRENESLIMRINQLNRQLGLQQSAKPSTSSVAISDKGTISDSSPRTANVKPMSGTASVQQSATVTPWRGGETPLASIRPISVQNARTAAILPTSQQSSAGSTAVVAGTSTSTSSTSSTSTPSSTPTSATGSSSNTALVPPQQQVHTTGSASLETMSSSPTSSHTDYMPSTSSSANVAVAAIPPMGSASAAESSQEAESIQQPQQNEPQPHVSGGSVNQVQVVALVSPRVEGSTAAPSAPSVTVQLMQDPNNPQPSTSQSTGCSSHIAVSSHNRHTPSSSNVTTTQAGSSAGHKRPRDLDGDSSTTGDDADKSTSKHPKRMRAPMQSGEAAVMTAAGVSDSGIDVDQVPTSSQRDQEDDVVVLDSEEDDGMAEAEAEADEGGPTDGDNEHEVYEDYDQDQDMDENDCPEVNESNLRPDVGEADNNEVDVDEDMETHGQCSSAGAVGQADADPYATGASTSAAAAAALARQDNNQQSQAISSGSGETSVRKQTNTLTRQQKATLMKLQQGVQGGEADAETADASGGGRRSESSEIVSSPQDSKFGYGATDTTSSNVAQQSDEHTADVGQENVDVAADESEAAGGEFLGEDYDEQKKGGDVTSEEGQKNLNEEEVVEDEEDDDDEFNEEANESAEVLENLDSEAGHSGATQSEIQDIQQNQIEATSEENEGADGVSSEGEKQAVEEIEEEGREAEASTSPSINTRSKATKGVPSNRRPHRGGFHRGANRTPIIWQESPGNSRNTSPNQRMQQDQPGSPARGGFNNQRGQRARRMRRPAGNFSNRF